MRVQELIDEDKKKLIRQEEILQGLRIKHSREIDIACEMIRQTRDSLAFLKSMKDKEYSKGETNDKS